MTLFELLYFLGYSIKKGYVAMNQKRLPHQVISIGNITLGGTGKTPATIALAGEAKQRGFRPCILTRGYKGKAKGPCFVSRGEGPLLSADEAGDEAVLMAEKLRDIPVVKGKNRYEAGMFSLSSLPSALQPDMFLLDDGFQHWALFRNKDIVLIDSSVPFGNRKMLPLGTLREPVKEIRRADIIVITKTPSHPSPSRGEGKGGGDSHHPKIESLIKEIKTYNPDVPIFLAEHSPEAFITAKGKTFSLEQAKGKMVFAFCGIGNPHSFRETLLSAGLQIKGFLAYRDHHRYSAGDMQSIKDNAERTESEWIVTTEKDIMRLRSFSMPENLVSLAIEFTVDGRFYDEVFS
ncbi:MAG: tetraacyldisaccharide 4'-kinase [Nitrospira sp.]|nr:tetraacyldisaccharide 4'-kinase [Nitrospira sp.]